MSKKVSSGFPIKSFNGIDVKTSILSSTANYYNYDSRTVTYIVMHYTGNKSDTAIANARYFASGSRSASAHYFVDENSCYQSVACNNAAWAVGGTSYYKHPSCRNKNSISIEMCCSGNYTVSKTTITNAAYLCAALCEYIGVTANSVDTYVLRHYDVWDKECPAQWASDNSSGWRAFKEQVKSILSGTATAANPYDEYLDKLVSKGIISDKAAWGYYSAPVSKAQAVALIDKASGGMWTSAEQNSGIHWAQPHVISLCGKGIIEDKSQWVDTLDLSISKAQLLALVDKATNGTLAQYADRATDHWGRNHLDSLCDKGIITTPNAWVDFEAEVGRGNTMALICKGFNIN